jgi:hypothetical protein
LRQIVHRKYISFCAFFEKTGQKAPETGGKPVSGVFFHVWRKKREIERESGEKTGEKLDEKTGRENRRKKSRWKKPMS